MSEIHKPLQEAQKQLGIALGQFSKNAGGAWIGSLGEYRKLVRLSLALASLAEKIKYKETECQFSNRNMRRKP